MRVNDPRGFDFGLGETADMLRDSVRGFAAERISPRADEIDRSNTFPRDLWPEPDMRLVEDDRPPAASLDDDALPAGWGDWITAEATARGCPRDPITISGRRGRCGSRVG